MKLSFRLQSARTEEIQIRIPGSESPFIPLPLSHQFGPAGVRSAGGASAYFPGCSSFA